MYKKYFETFIYRSTLVENTIAIFQLKNIYPSNISNFSFGYHSTKIIYNPQDKNRKLAPDIPYFTYPSYYLYSLYFYQRFLQLKKNNFYNF